MERHVRCFHFPFITTLSENNKGLMKNIFMQWGILALPLNAGIEFTHKIWNNYNIDKHL